MISIKEAVIVEGKYDKIKIASIVNACIIVTNGFGIFKDREKLDLIRYYAKKTGIVIMTDSDHAGQQIRNYIRGAVHEGRILNVYIPDVFGKEKRKKEYSAEGKLGVEGIKAAVIREALERGGVTVPETERAPETLITRNDMYFLGLSGGSGSSENRKRIKKYLRLPSSLSSASLTEVLNTMMTLEELKKLTAELGITEKVND